MPLPFYVFAWTASFIYGFYVITAKLIGKYQLKNVSQFAFFSMLFGGLTIASISFLNGARLAPDWSFIILAAIFAAISSILFITALKNLEVSVMGPLFNIKIVISVLLGYLFLNESLATANILIILLIIVAGFFSTMDESFSWKSFFTRNVGVGLLCMLALSIQSVFINQAIAQTDYWTASLWIGLLTIVFGFIFLYRRFKNDLAASKPRDYLGVFVLALMGGVGDLASIKAYESNVGVSSVIISLPISMVLAFLFSAWKPSLLEKHTWQVYVVRFTAAAVMIWGAWQLSKGF